AVDPRRLARRGAGHDRGRVRAVPAAARLHPAHAARAHDHEARTCACRRDGRRREALLAPAALWSQSAEESLELHVSTVRPRSGARHRVAATSAGAMSIAITSNHTYPLATPLGGFPSAIPRPGIVRAHRHVPIDVP